MNDLPSASNLVPAPVAGAFPRTWQQIFDQLVEDFAPEGFFERMWLRDIARLTFRIDQLHAIHSAVHAYNFYCATHGEHEDGSGLVALDRTIGWTRSQTELVPIQEFVAGLSDFMELSLADVDVALARMLGMTYSRHYTILRDIEGHIAMLLGQRDSIIGFFEDRRRKRTSDKLVKFELERLSKTLDHLQPGREDEA